MFLKDQRFLSLIEQSMLFPLTRFLRIGLSLDRVTMGMGQKQVCFGLHLRRMDN
jgi:hypothetical protein